jgi:hypothetical protein
VLFITLPRNDNQILICLSEIIFIFVISFKAPSCISDFFSNLMFLANIKMVFFTLTDQFTTFDIKMAKIFIFAMIIYFKTSPYTEECSFINFLSFFCCLDFWTWWKSSSRFFIFQSLHKMFFKVESYAKWRLIKFYTFFFSFLDEMTLMFEFFKTFVEIFWSVFKFTGNDLTNNCFFFDFICTKVSFSYHQCITSLSSSFFSCFNKF